MIFFSFEKEIDSLFVSIGRPLRLIVGFSGGGDSSLLLDYLYQYYLLYPDKIAFVLVVYVNEGLSEKILALKESDDEEKALLIEKKKLCCQFSFLSVFLSIDSCLSAESYEDAMHKMRKKIFLEQKQEHHIDRILLGHHQDDQLEHFFIGLCRGSSIKRISGMKKDSGVFYRPFLDCPKKEIIDTLKAKKISFLDDPTNQLSFSLRNNLRKKIIPQLDEVEKRARGHILSFLKKLQSQEACLEKIKRREWERIVKSDQSFDVRDFLMIDDVLQNLILQSLWYRYNPLVVFTQGIYDEIKRFFIYGKKTKHQIANIVIKKKRHMISFSS